MPHSSSFLSNNLSKDYLNETKSDLIIVSEEIDSIETSKTIIRVSNPKRSFFHIVKEYFYVENYNCSSGIHDSAIISKKSNKICGGLYLK